ncbi:MAG: hypothetical protein ABIZ49_09910, partial [Opitutaceae bacterium]
MAHETSYTSGQLSAPELGIYAGWIAHAGSFAAHHSVTDDRNGISLAFSGECFRDTMPGASSGPIARAKSWVAESYLDQGFAFAATLNGLFSGLLVDRREKRALLFNDRYGLERIYVHEIGEDTYFASEAKALLKILPNLRAFDPTGVAQYLAYGCTLESQTLFRGISLLPPASSWAFVPRVSIQRKTYFAPGEWETQETMSQPQFEAAFAEAF